MKQEFVAKVSFRRQNASSTSLEYAKAIADLCDRISMAIAYGKQPDQSEDARMYLTPTAKITSINAYSSHDLMPNSGFQVDELRLSVDFEPSQGTPPS